jgi:hypothetical protein
MPRQRQSSASRSWTRRKVTRLAGLDGALLKMEPVSLARPDSAYKNIAEIDEAVADLKQSGAPPEVIAELEADHQDEEE